MKYAANTIWTAVLSVLIWTAFHFASMPLGATDAPIVVGVSALVVFAIRKLSEKLKPAPSQSPKVESKDEPKDNA